MKKTLIFFLFAGLAAITAVPSMATGNLYAEDAYIRAMPPGQQITAAFLKLVNPSEKACQITGGSSSIATELQIHEHLHSDGMMKMRPVASVTVEAGTTLTFKPGQHHLMLFGIQAPLVPGQAVEFSLTTENCGSLVVVAEVRSLFKSKPAASKHNDKPHNHSMHGNHK